LPGAKRRGKQTAVAQLIKSFSYARQISSEVLAYLETE